VAVGGRETAAGGAEGVPEGGGRVLGDGGAVADGDRLGLEVAQGAAGREGADERVNAEEFVVGGEEVADRAEDVGADEEAAVGQPECDLVPAGEADDTALIDAGGERLVRGQAVPGGDGFGVAAMALHEGDDPDDRRPGERFVEPGRVDGISEEPAVGEPDRGRGSPQELVRMGEPGEAPVLVEAVRLQGAGC
jgi:hypothetical protein